jgi:hypothetical protein
MSRYDFSYTPQSDGGRNPSSFLKAGNLSSVSSTGYDRLPSRRFGQRSAIGYLSLPPEPSVSLFPMIEAELRHPDRRGFAQTACATFLPPQFDEVSLWSDSIAFPSGLAPTEENPFIACMGIPRHCQNLDNGNSSSGLTASSVYFPPAADFQTQIDYLGPTVYPVIPTMVDLSTSEAESFYAATATCIGDGFVPEQSYLTAQLEILDPFHYHRISENETVNDLMQLDEPWDFTEPAPHLSHRNHASTSSGSSSRPQSTGHNSPAGSAEAYYREFTDKTLNNDNAEMIASSSFDAVSSPNVKLNSEGAIQGTFITLGEQKKQKRAPRSSDPEQALLLRQRGGPCERCKRLKAKVRHTSYFLSALFLNLCLS